MGKSTNMGKSTIVINSNNRFMKSMITLHIICSITLILSSCSYKNYELVNRTWDAYLLQNKDGDSTNNYFITYTFRKDGTFTESHKIKDIQGLDSDYLKSWEMDRGVLNITLIRQSDNTVKSTDYNIYWLNKSQFYVVEENEVTGVKTYIYCYARDGNTE